MTTTRTFTAEDIAVYLDDSTLTNEHDLTSISTCIRIISRYNVTDEDRSVELVQAAVDSIADWASGYGVQIAAEVDENEV